MNLEPFRKASELSEQDKARIREEIEKTSEELRPERRRELAAEYGVALKGIGAITAWTTIRANQALSDKVQFQKSSKLEQRRLMHAQIIRDHFYYNHAIGRPIERTRHEIQQIFSGIYEPEELLSMIVAIEGEKFEEGKTTVCVPDVDAKLGERVDYDNEKKNASREWWLNLLWKYTQHADKSKMNLLLLPGPECHELSPVISMGFPPENLRCYNLGKDPTASAVFIRNCQQQAVFNWRLGDLEECLPEESERVYGGNLDFTGFYSEKNERILSYLPVPKNGRMYYSINFEKKRERKDITGQYRQIVAYSQKQAMSPNSTFAESLSAKEKSAYDAYFGLESFETGEVRKEALWTLIEENLGVARSENWLCFQELREMVLATGRFPDFDAYDSYEKVNAIRCVLTTFEDCIMVGLAGVLEKHGFCGKMDRAIAQALMIMVRKGSFNETQTMNCHQYEYCSPTGSPFISHFVVCENFYDTYRSMEKSMKFFIGCLTNYIKDIERHNSDEAIQKMRSNNIGEQFDVRHTSRFVIEGRGNNGKIIFKNSDPDSKIEISMSQILRDTNRMIDFLKKHVSRSDRFAKRFDHAASPDGGETVDTSLNDLSKGDSGSRPHSQMEPIHTLPHGQIISTGVKIGRNEPCHCGSGKKFKKCCGRSNS